MTSPEISPTARQEYRPPAPRDDGSILRELYEEAVFKGDQAMEQLIRIDTAIDTHLGTFAQGLRDIENPEDFQDLMEFTSKTGDYMEKEKLNDEAASDNWVTSLRLASRKDLLYETVLAPLVYTEDDSPFKQQLRYELSRGLFERSIHALEFAVSAYDDYIQSEYATAREGDELTGMINELTTIALINRNEDRDRIATISLFQDDHLEDIDVMVWRSGEYGNTPVPLQVKSSTGHRPTRTTVITGREMLFNYRNGKEPFSTARPLVKEANLEATEAETARLSRIEDALYI